MPGALQDTTNTTTAAAVVAHEDTPHTFTPVHQEQPQQPQQQPPSIDQLSVFKLLPSELVLDIFSYLDIVTIFRFLDTCRYHRYLLLNLPEIWQRVRFIPLSEYTTTSSSSTPLSFTTLSAAAAATGHSSPSSTLENASGDSTAVVNGSRSSIAPTAGHSRYRRPTRTRKTRSRDESDSSSGSESGSDRSDDTKTTNNGSNTTGTATTTTMTNGGASAHRLKHAENERDRERGGSRSLISEIYAVLRRFRKENRLVDFVREIYMDSTDSQHFPSPLVMLIKFPNLHTLSSRYRRNQTSLTTDTHTLKDLLRNGDILPHSLRLRKWDIFHPYMTKEDINGFKIILDAISAVGAERDLNGTTGSGGQGGQGVLLDIKMCPGPVVYEPNAGSSLDGSQVHVGGGMHWATPNGQYQQQHQYAAPVATTHSIPPSTTTPPPPTEGQPVTSTAPSAPPCTNIVWTLEKCRVCDASHSRCYRCVGQCSACGAVRAPPFINHQTLLERERARQTIGRAASPAVVVVAGSSATPGAEVISGVSVAGMAAVNGNGRPRTPPGSISLSQMANSSQPIASAYHSSGGFPVLSSPFWALPVPLPVIPVALTVPPEFSLFD